MTPKTQIVDRMRRMILATILTFCHLAAATFFLPDLSVSKLVLGQGYPFQEFEVVTEDGYILSLHRIPFGKNSQGKIGRPVIVQHGLMLSSACWVLSRPDQSLGFILADHGYDVWLPNNRGNTYSLKHLTLDAKNLFHLSKYWDFSFHEMGYYDLPAIIDFILNKTNHKKLFYIGHSLGTTQFFALMSTRPEYNEKVIHMSALAPVAFLNSNQGKLKASTFQIDELAKYCSFPLLKKISPICHTLPMTLPITKDIIFNMVGFGSPNINATLFPIIKKYIPADTSTKQLLHLGQLVHNGHRFTQFTGEEYDLSKVTTPVTLHYSENDWISGVKDVEKLRSMLPNAESILVPSPNFTHPDFMWAKNAWTLLYKPMLEALLQY